VQEPFPCVQWHVNHCVNRGKGNLRPRHPPHEYLGEYTGRGKPKIPPVDQILMDPGHKASKQRSDIADLGFQAVGPALRIMQLNIEGLSAAFLIAYEKKKNQKPKHSTLSETSAILSSRCPTVSRRLAFVCSIASNFTRTASIFDTMLPIECSIRSTLRCSIENSSCVTPRPPRLFPPHPLRPVPPRISDFVVVESSSSSLRSKLSESSFSANCK